MPEYYTLLYGRSKKRLKPIAIDVLSKILNLKAARVKSSRYIAAGHHEIVPAGKDCQPWRKETSNQWTNYNSPLPKEPVKQRKGQNKRPFQNYSITLEARQWVQIPKQCEMPQDVEDKIYDAVKDAKNWTTEITLSLPEETYEVVSGVIEAIDNAGEWAFGYEEYWPELFEE